MPYDATHLEGKDAAKRLVLETFGLPTEDEVRQRPLVAMISRLVDQKGHDLVAEIARNSRRLTRRSSSWARENAIRGLWRILAHRYPDRIGARIGFDEALAHRIEAGADLFLMPSRFEPCGLNQMYSLRYGTVPVVRATGGLYDTVRNFDAATGDRHRFHVRAVFGLRTAADAAECAAVLPEPAGLASSSSGWDGAGLFVGRARPGSTYPPMNARQLGYSPGPPGGDPETDQRENEMASDKLKTLTDSNFEQEIQAGVVLVDFWAEWCGPCRRIAPIVEELAGQYDGRATVGKLNVDENPNVPGRFMIRGIPTLLLFKNGQLADTLVGLAPKEDIAKMIDKHL